MRTKKVALVTGAPSDIGKELARIHAKQSGDLARRQDKLHTISDVTLTQRMMTAAIPLTPQKMLLRQTRQMQEANDVI